VYIYILYIYSVNYDHNITLLASHFPSRGY